MTTKKKAPRNVASMRRIDRFAELGFRGAPSMREFIGNEPDRRVVAYLRQGWCLAATSGTAVDVLDPSRGSPGFLDDHTDGVWRWTETLPYYVETYGLRRPGGVSTSSICRRRAPSA